MKDEETIVMTRIFDAPRSRVFEAWTRAEHIGRWFAPKGFAITDVECDPRPGGVFRMCMRAPWGGAYWVRGEYREVFAPERLVIACALEHEEGSSLNSTARGIGAKGPSMLAGMQKGWAQTVDRLGILLNPKPHKEM